MIAEMAELREVLVGLARERVSPKQAKMALGHTSEDDLNVDPGIRSLLSLLLPKLSTI